MKTTRILSVAVLTIGSALVLYRAQQEQEAYRRDVPKAEGYVLDAGHFALDTAADQIAQLVRGFMK